MRAAWLEPHDQYEGVGAHETNPRYDPVDDDPAEVNKSLLFHLPALAQARGFLSAALVAGPVTRLDGIDGSHYQPQAGPMDFDVLAAIPTWWWAWKATQSISYTDPTFTNARALAGTRFTHRLFYHWLSSTTDVEQQAAHFLAVIGQLQPGEGVMLDAEEAGITAAGVALWCDTVEMSTRRPCAVYTGAYVAGGGIWQTPGVRGGGYGPRPMHLAAYTTEAKARALPGVAAFPWDAWQYSSNGPVAGITGRCDMNRVDGRDVYNTACAVAGGSAHARTQEDEMGLASNAQTRTMPYGSAPPLSAIFLTGLQKRNIGQEERDKLYPGVVAVPLSNAALDAIPDLLVQVVAGAQGAVGPTGQQGAVGAQGQQGVAGTVGPTGAQGIAGATGAKGTDAAEQQVTGTFTGKTTGPT